MSKTKADRKAERAEKKAAKQAGKAGKKAAVLGPALLQLPATITASQRARIHAAARSVGLFHESSGEGDARVLTVGHETADLEIIPEGPVDEEGLQELLFERLGLVLLPPGAGTGTAAGRAGKGSTTQEPTLEDFVGKTRELLQQEEQQEVEQAEAELSNYSPSGAQAAGRSLLGLRCDEASTGFLGKTLLTLVRNKGPVSTAAPSGGKQGDSKAPSNPLPAHKFSPHDVVAVRPNAMPKGGSGGASEEGQGDLAQGVVYRVYEDKIVVAVEELADSATLDVPLRVDKLANKVTYERMEKVLHALEHDTDAPGRHLLDIAFAPMARSPHFSEGAPKWTPVATNSLDASQRSAVALALAASDIALIHGPPGTGKTTSLVEVILAEAARGHRVLYCAASNVAVDNTVERLARAAPARVRARVVRVGHPARLLPEVLEHSLEAAVLRSDGSAVAAGCREEAQALARRLVKLSGRRDAAERREVRGEMRRLAKEEKRRQSAAADEVLTAAVVTCCTLTGVHSAHLRGRQWDLAVVDEAAQAMEVATWGALLRARRAVLAGDHLQLPPTVMCDKAAAQGLATTLFERLHRMHGHAAHMLTTQYRMHADIMTWASQALYKGRLQAHASVAAHTLQDIRGKGLGDKHGDKQEDGHNGDANACSDAPLVLVDTAGCGAEEMREEEGASWYNDAEVACVVGLVKEHLEGGLKPECIGVITPYSAQKSR